VISVKIEPQQLLEADWLFARLGYWLTVDISDGPTSMGPLFETEEAEDDQVDDEVLVPSNGRRRNGTRSSEQA